MPISNLSSQYISQSFQSLVQIDTVNGNIYDGLGAQINNVNATASFAVTSSCIRNLTQNVIITGSLSVSGSQTFRGNKTISGSVFITGSKTIIGNTSVTGAMNISGTLSLTGPSIQNAAALTSPLISGSMEFDGSTFYRTADVNGRSLNANHHLYYLPSQIVHTAVATTIVDVFSGSLNAYNMLPNSLYEVQYNLFYEKFGAAGTITWTINGGNQTWQNAHIQMERTGITAANGTSTGSIAPFATTGVAPVYTTHFNAANISSIALSSGIDSNNSEQKIIIKVLIQSNTSQPSILKLQHACSAGTINIYPGSYYTIKKMPVSSVGVFTE